MNPIRPEMTIAEIIGNYPETKSVFTSYGLEPFTQKDFLNKLGPFLKLQTVLQAKEINQNLFIHLLGTKITELRKVTAESVSLDVNRQGDLNLLGLLPCPLKVPLQEAFQLFLQERSPSQNVNLTYCLEGNANNQLSYYDYIEFFEKPDDLPDIIISPGINSFFYHHFVSKFIQPGHFTNALNQHPLSSKLSELGLEDPQGHYNMLAANLSVIVVDHTRQGNLPLPQSWGDLLQPEFTKQVAIRGSGSFFCETLLLNIYQDYGLEGIRKLGGAVKTACHPAQMVKCIGTSKPEGAAISIIPLFFAQTIKNKEKVSIIWPEEGAIVSPVSILVKTAKKEQLKEIIEFWLSPEVGRICTQAYFPSLHPEVDNQLPPEAKLKWLGWDYLRSQDLESLINQLTEEFMSTYQGGRS